LAVFWAFADCPHGCWRSASRLFLPADDERGRLAICRTIGWLSHVRTCPFEGCDAGRQALYAWQRLLAVGGGPGLHRLRALWLAIGYTTLPPSRWRVRTLRNLPEDRLFIARTHLPLYGLGRGPTCAGGVAAVLGFGGEPSLCRLCGRSVCWPGLAGQRFSRVRLIRFAV
jgi:hypothetical protein